MSNKNAKKLILHLGIYMMILCFHYGTAFSESIPEANSYLPEFQLEAPLLERERIYLGIGSEKLFSIDQLNCELVLIKIVGVYCPKCHIQMPYFNKLFYRIKKVPGIYQKTKMLAIAVGANPLEVEYFKKEHRIPYPVIKDPKFEIHKLLGEPRTPFIMLVTREKRVIFAHLGIIKEIDKLFLKIRKLVQ
ncbi:MAG: TlpA disulfide reductase family protein [Desulfobacterales bacterium]